MTCAPGWKWRNVLSHDGDPLADFEIRAQSDDDHILQAEPVYGWEWGFDFAGLVTLAELEEKAKAARAVDRWFRERAKLEGSPSMFALFLNRVARAVGAKGFVIFERSGGFSYSESEWSAFEITDGATVERRLCAAFRARYERKEVSA